jgi:hypothetical protein
MHKHDDKRGTQSGPAAPTARTQTAVASGDKDRNAPLVSVEDIRLCAYRKWESAGKPAGDCSNAESLGNQPRSTCSNSPAATNIGTESSPPSGVDPRSRRRNQGLIPEE